MKNHLKINEFLFLSLFYVPTPTYFLSFKKKKKILPWLFPFKFSFLPQSIPLNQVVFDDSPVMHAQFIKKNKFSTSTNC